MPTIPQITEAISAFRRMSGTGSITPAVEANLFQSVTDAVADVASDVTEIGAAIESVEQDVGILDSSVDSLTTQVETLSGAISNMAGGVSLNTQNIGKLAGRMTEAETAVGTLETDVAGLKTSVGSLGTAVDGHTRALGQVSANANAITALGNRVTAIEGGMPDTDALDDRITALEENVPDTDALDNRLTALEENMPTVPEFVKNKEALTTSICKILWEGAVLSDASTYPKASGEGWMPNGCVGDTFWLFGEPLSVQQTLTVLSDPWQPGLHSLRPKGMGNVPPLLNAYGRPDLSWATTGNADIKVVCLGRSLTSNCTPSDMERAFAGCVNLHTIVGTICLDELTDDKIFDAFAQCGNLRLLLLSNIPTAVSVIDLSQTSSKFVEDYQYFYQTESRTINPLEYMLTHIGTLRQPSDPLLIKLHMDCIAKIYANQTLAAAVATAYENFPGLQIQGIPRQTT